jgi:hypothetical protein
VPVLDLTPSQKGAAAEAAITSAAIGLGLTVLRPLCEGRRYDIVIDLEPELLRVQCKWACRRNGVLSVSLRTNRLTPGGYVSTAYTAAEVDAIGAYSPELGSCFLIPIAEVSEGRGVHLRLEPARNNQARRIRWAHEYEFGAMVSAMR